MKNHFFRFPSSMCIEELCHKAKKPNELYPLSDFQMHDFLIVSE